MNEKRLQAQVARLTELQSAVDIMGRIIANKAITGTESEGLLKVIISSTGKTSDAASAPIMAAMGGG